jgi:hypothetical protein
MSTLNITHGFKGQNGTGLTLLTWRNSRSCSSTDTAGVTTRYLERWGDRFFSAPNTTSTAIRSLIKLPRGGNLKNFLARFDATPPVSTLFEVLVNGVATALSLQSSDALIHLDTTNSVAVFTGDQVQVRVSFASGTPVNTQTSPQAMLTLI